MRFSELAEITSGDVISLPEDRVITHLLLDSRKLSNHPGALFFAVIGPNHDGHEFLKEVYDNGVRQFVISNKKAMAVEAFADANIIVVENVMFALQAVAAAHRSSFDLPVIGITGSNGKTIVKEWLSELISECKRVVKSPKSYNSQVGVPLSVWQISEEDEVGVFEAGISVIGEMEKLEAIIKPTIGIFTNLGPSHDEGFHSREEKITEKLKLFKDCQQVIYCRDQDFVHRRMQKFALYHKTVSLISWSTANPEADFYYQVDHQSITINGQSITKHLSGKSLEENLLHCITACLLLGISFHDLAGGVSKLSPLSMRLEMKRAVNGCYLVDDTYSNDLTSLESALDFINQQLQDKPKTVVLSDILQSGQSSESLYSKVNEVLRDKGVQRLIGVGNAIGVSPDLFEMESLFYGSTEELLQDLATLKFNSEVILVKGARTFGLERIVDVLQEKIHGTRLEIDLSALTENLNYYRRVIKPEVKLMVMVKALAYGGGSYEIASLLQYHKVDYLSVAYVDEGVELRGKGITLPIMVLNVAPESFHQLKDYQLEPEIYSLVQLGKLLDYLGDNELSIHLKVETGMNRLGFKQEEVSDLLKMLDQHPNIKVKSVFSHLAASEDKTNDDFTHQQFMSFQGAYDAISAGLGYQPLRHILNSAGITRFAEYQMEMVRLGIGLYGVSNSPEVQANLKPVSTLKTSISQIHHIDKGDSVGYGRSFIAKSPTTVATLAIGYADGYDRRFGNGVGKVMINGQVAPTIGNVCMDMIMADVTNIETNEGDEAVIFGEEMSVSEVASSIGTIPYEILTNVGPRVRRVFHSE